MTNDVLQVEGNEQTSVHSSATLLLPDPDVAGLQDIAPMILSEAPELSSLPQEESPPAAVAASTLPLAPLAPEVEVANETEDGVNADTRAEAVTETAAVAGPEPPLNSPGPVSEPTTPSTPVPRSAPASLKHWFKSITGRSKAHRFPERYVIGWPEDEAQDISYSMFRPFQKGYWNELLGEVKDELSESTGNSHVCQCPGCTWQVEDKDTAAAANRKSDVDKTSITSSSILRTVKTASVSGTSFSRISTGRPATGSNTASSGVQNSSLEAGSTGNSSLQDAAVAAAAAAATTEDAGQGRASVEAARQDMAEEANRRDSALSVFRSSLSLDEEAWDRAVQRRETLKEFLNTESTYVTGLKSLADALSTYIPTRTTIYRSTLEMLALHQRLLEGLVIFIPPADHSIPSASFFQCPNRPPQDEGCVAAKPNPDASGGKDVKPNRRSLTSRALKQPIETRIRTSKHVAAETKDAARVAQLLQAILPDLAVYEDYSVTVQLVQKELEVMRKSMPNWQVFDRGIEALAKSVAPDDKRGENKRQAFTFEDMLMKPLQRVCKYQLLLANLLKYTPVVDDPHSHAVIDAALHGMLEVNQNFNRVSGDPLIKDRIQKTLLLREMLLFPKQPYIDVLREFGSLSVCGVLYVAYQTESAVTGEYMMCCLFKTHLLLATASGESQFSVVATLRLVDVKLQLADNGIGMHCDTTPYVFKLVFLIGRTLYEFALTACSDKEASQWKECIIKHSTAEAVQATDSEPAYKRAREKRSTLQLPLKPLEATIIDEKLHSSRRNSFHNTLDVCDGQTNDIIRLLIKGTGALPQQDTYSNYASTFTVNRSLSLQSQRQAALLAPKRQDRIRLERWLHDIWTTDILPYPGMPSWRGESLLRSHATSLMRKMSTKRLLMRRSSSVATNISGISAHSTASTASTNSGLSANGRSGESTRTVLPPPPAAAAMKRKNSGASTLTWAETVSNSNGGASAGVGGLLTPISTPDEEETNSGTTSFLSFKPKRHHTVSQRPPPTPLERSSSRRLSCPRYWSHTWSAGIRKTGETTDRTAVLSEPAGGSDGANGAGAGAGAAVAAGERPSMKKRWSEQFLKVMNSSRSSQHLSAKG